MKKGEDHSAIRGCDWKTRSDTSNAILGILACCFLAKSYPTLLQPHDLKPTRLLSLWNFPGRNTGMGRHFLLQGIFPTQGSNLSLLLGGRFFTTEPPGKQPGSACSVVSLQSEYIGLVDPEGPFFFNSHILYFCVDSSFFLVCVSTF